MSSYNEAGQYFEAHGAHYSVLSAESQYFDTLFRQGLIGISFIFLMLFRLIYLLFKLIKIDIKFSNIYKGLLIGFIGVCVALIFLPMLRDRNFALFFFTVYAFLSSRLYKTLFK